MLFSQVEVGRIIELVDFPVDAGTHKPLCSEVGQQLDVLTFAFIDHRGQQQQASFFRYSQNLVDHLAYCLCLEVVAMVGAAWATRASVKQAQVVVDFCDGADRGPRIM